MSYVLILSIFKIFLLDKFRINWFRRGNDVYISIVSYIKTVGFDLRENQYHKQGFCLISFVCISKILWPPYTMVKWAHLDFSWRVNVLIFYDVLVGKVWKIESTLLFMTQSRNTFYFFAIEYEYIYPPGEVQMSPFTENMWLRYTMVKI